MRCSICDTPFANKWALRAHRWRMHGGGRPKAPEVKKYLKLAQIKSDDKKSKLAKKGKHPQRSKASRSDIMSQWGRRLPGSGWAGRGQR